jgi:integrase
VGGIGLEPPWTSSVYFLIIEEVWKTRDVSMIRFHDLRHTAASLILNQGVPIFKVSKILGHARPSITSDIYGHVMPNGMDGIGDMMDELIAPIQVNISL